MSVLNGLKLKSQHRYDPQSLWDGAAIEPALRQHDRSSSSSSDSEIPSDSERLQIDY